MRSTLRPAPSQPGKPFSLVTSSDRVHTHDGCLKTLVLRALGVTESVNPQDLSFRPTSLSVSGFLVPTDEFVSVWIPWSIVQG